MIMKNFIPFFLLLYSMTLCAQLQENFQDGLFYGQPGRQVNWEGDCSEFRVNEELMLQLNSTVDRSPVQLRIPSTLTRNTSWEFYVRIDFTPSASNYAEIYLISDAEDLCGALNGLFIRIGYSDQNICLMQAQVGKNNKTLIRGDPDRLDADFIGLHVKATLDSSGRFRLYAKLNEEEEWIEEGSCQLETIPSGQCFGMVCFFTTTRSQLFYFDDFSIKKFDENEEPIIDPNPEQDDAVYGDLLFSEIMSHPKEGDPEYIELYNGSKRTIDLQDYLFFYGDKSYALPVHTILPDSYFVLTKRGNANTFPPGTQVYEVNSFPTLANTGKLLMIQTQFGGLISWFEYSDTLYQEEGKEKGGWSLECKDLNNRSNLADNWSASTHATGGTPGKINAIACNHPDIDPISIDAIRPIGDQGIQIVFSKPMQPDLLLDSTSYALADDYYRITDIQSNYPQCTEVRIRLEPYPENGTWTDLYLPGVKDLSDYSFEEDFFIRLGSDQEAVSHDIAINELLFNPETDNKEYVEIINRSDKILDLRFLSITSRKPSDGSFNKTYPLSALPCAWHPGEYAVITPSRELVCRLFNCSENALWTETDDMPSLTNTAGCVVILNNLTNEVIDEFYYNESMHAPSINNPKGVALERISLDVSTNDPSNWTSASFQSGYGTPGAVNSQEDKDRSIDSNRITLDYPDAMNEYYRINYLLDQPGYNCRAIIFDSMGRIVRHLINNVQLGTEGSISWNGKSESNHSFPTGVYIIYIEIFDIKGRVESFKIPVLLK